MDNFGIDGYTGTKLQPDSGEGGSAMEGKGSVSLRPWTMEDKEDLARLCNGVDRSYVRNSLPFPYTEKDAEWWIGMTLDRDGKDGVFRAVCLDGKVVGNISVEQGTDVYRCGAEIGYMLDRGVWSQGIMTEAAGLICKEDVYKRQVWRRRFTSAIPGDPAAGAGLRESHIDRRLSLIHISFNAGPAV